MALVDSSNPELIDRGEALRPVGHILAEAVVAVVDGLRDDLTEAERDDCQIVAAQSKRGHADDHAERAENTAAATSSSQKLTCTPGGSG